MKKLVIFDLDGTLINTLADLAASTNYGLKLNHFPTHKVDEYRYFVGNGINKLFERALPEDDRTRDNILLIRKAFLEYYGAHIADMSRPYAGIPELLKKLKADGIMVAVCSNKYQEGSDKILKVSLPDIAFDTVHGQRDGVKTKPDPMIIHQIMDELGVNDEKEILYCGDSGVDAATAQNAGIDCCSVLWGFRPKTEMEPFHPAYYATKPEQIYDIAIK